MLLPAGGRTCERSRSELTDQTLPSGAAAERSKPSETWTSNLASICAALMSNDLFGPPSGPVDFNQPVAMMLPLSIAMASSRTPKSSLRLC